MPPGIALNEQGRGLTVAKIGFDVAGADDSIDTILFAERQARDAADRLMKRRLSPAGERGVV